MTWQPSAICAQSLNIAHDFTEPTAVSRTIRTRSGSLSLHKCADCAQLSSFVRTSIHTVSHWFVCPPASPNRPTTSSSLVRPQQVTSGKQLAAPSRSHALPQLPAFALHRSTYVKLTGHSWSFPSCYWWSPPAAHSRPTIGWTLSAYSSH